LRGTSQQVSKGIFYPAFYPGLDGCKRLLRTIRPSNRWHPFDTRDHPHRARKFYIRRTLRIFPRYYGIFLSLLLLNPVIHWNWSPSWLAWPLYPGNFLRFRSPANRRTKTLPAHH
jgi:hypothetical protein